MQIRTFDEVDPFEIHKLTLASFGWAAPERRMRQQIRADPRVMEGYGRYAVERGRILAMVVPLKMPVRLASGVETIGGVAAVCSLPEVWGRGYIRRLMEHVHGLYREEGFRIAALTTSRNIRGYGVYRKLGYVDLAPFYRATKRIRVRPAPPDDVQLRHPRARDIPRIQALFRAFAKPFYGWTERHTTFLGGEQIWFEDILDRFRLVYRGGDLVGYLRTIPGEEDFSEEYVVRRSSDFRAAVHAVESRTRYGFSNITPLTTTPDLARFRRLGYDILGPTPSTAMAIPLTPGLRGKDLPRLFGGPQGRFLLSPTDAF